MRCAPRGGADKNAAAAVAIAAAAGESTRCTRKKPRAATARLTGTPPPPPIGWPWGWARMLRTNKPAPENSQWAWLYCVPCRALRLRHASPCLYRVPGVIAMRAARPSEVPRVLHGTEGRKRRRSSLNRPRPRSTFSCGVCTSRLCLNMKGVSLRLYPLERS